MLPSIPFTSSRQIPSFQFQEINSTRSDNPLLEDYSKIADTFQLILRLFTLTLEQDQTIGTAAQLTILQGHLIKTNRIRIILAVECVICEQV